MALVGYSDSEASDDEQPQNVPPELALKPATKAEPAGKLLSQDSRKIRVNLSSLARNEDEASEDAERPAKRARTGGGLGGFNAMLPAPKNLNTSSGTGSTSAMSLGRGGGLGRGISLKTSAQAAFSRDAPPPPEEETDASGQAQDTTTTVSNAPKADVEEQQEAVKPAAGNNIRFVPKSVTRKKRKTPLVSPAPATNTPQQAVAPPPPAAQPEAQAPPPPKKKKSLFATGEEEAPVATAIPADSGTYKPLIEDDDLPLQPTAQEPTPQQDPPPAANSQPQPSNLQDLANSLNLSAAERRKLFGRHGNQATNAQVASFDLAAEYKTNRELVEKEGAVPAHNPVKAIAPGKHSLQQLINNAQHQSEALEEQFAAGKRNKKEAGKKFGWG